MQNKDSYKKLLLETSHYYKNLKKIICKHIDNNFIIFGNSGFTHLLIKDRKSRPINEQFRKLSLVKHIPEVMNAENVKIEKRITENKEYGYIEYMGLSGKVGGRTIKVVLRKIGSGNYHFWSIMDN